jgi:predicted nucleotidyltransferase component of viral defense system
MLNNELKRWLEFTAYTLNVGEEFIEKDWYVTRAIQALSELKLPDLQLVFAGGTCLAKSHRVANRMSEDVDFKVSMTEDCAKVSTSFLRKKLSNLRQQVQISLIAAGFECNSDCIRARNNNRFMVFDLPYYPLLSAKEYLRSTIQVELTVSTLQLPTEYLPVQTLIADVIGERPELPQAKVATIALVETAAEKWVALTRRIAMCDRGYLTLDKTLIRHLYDLHQIFTAGKLTEQFPKLINQIIATDQMQFKNQHPEYFNDPLSEIKRSLQLLEHNVELKQYWQDFIDAMVIEKPAPTYEKAFQTFSVLSQPVLAML